MEGISPCGGGRVDGLCVCHPTPPHTAHTQQDLIPTKITPRPPRTVVEVVGLGHASAQRQQVQEGAWKSGFVMFDVLLNRINEPYGSGGG